MDKQLPMNMTVILADKPSSFFAAMFTSNQFPGGRILVGKNCMKTSSQIPVQAILIVVNNKSPRKVECRGAGGSERVPRLRLPVGATFEAMRGFCWSYRVIGK